MTNQQDRRERIAAQVLAGMAACGSDCALQSEVQLAVRIADELIAELDRTAPQSNQPESPVGWVIWDDEDDDGRPIRDRQFWVDTNGVEPFLSKKEAEDEMSSWRTDHNCRVRKWPLDPAEDKPEVQP